MIVRDASGFNIKKILYSYLKVYVTNDYGYERVVLGDIEIATVLYCLRLTHKIHSIRRNHYKTIPNVFHHFLRWKQQAITIRRKCNITRGRTRNFHVFYIRANVLANYKAVTFNKASFDAEKKMLTYVLLYSVYTVYKRLLSSFKMTKMLR